MARKPTSSTEALDAITKAVEKLTTHIYDYASDTYQHNGTIHDASAIVAVLIGDLVDDLDGIAIDSAADRAQALITKARRSLGARRARR